MRNTPQAMEAKKRTKRISESIRSIPGAHLRVAVRDDTDRKKNRYRLHGYSDLPQEELYNRLKPIFEKEGVNFEFIWILPYSRVGI